MSSVTATVTLIDDEIEADKIRLEVTPSSVAENADESARTITVTAIAEGNSEAFLLDRMVSVLAFDNDILGAADYTLDAFQITIPAGQTSGKREVLVGLTDDTYPEVDVVITLDAVSSVEVPPGEDPPNNVPVTQATLTLTDDDDDPVLTLSGPGEVGEEDGVAVFTVSFDAPSGKTISVSYEVVLGTASKQDFTLASGPNPIMIYPSNPSTPSERLTTTITIRIVADTVDEGLAGETLSLRVTATNALLSDGTSASAGTSERLTIIDDDVARPTITVADVTMVEGDPEDGPGALVFTVRLSGPVSKNGSENVDVSVAYATMTGTAHNPDDFSSTSGTLSISAGDTLGYITVAVESDNRHEGNETFTLELSNLMPARYVLFPDRVGTLTATGTISDNDDAPTEIVLGVMPPEIGEGDGATIVTVTATVKGGTTFGTSTEVSVTVAQGDLSPMMRFLPVEDFVITIVAGAATGTATFTLTPQQDEVDKPDGTVRVSGNIIGANNTPNVTRALITLIDDDDDRSVIVMNNNIILNENGTATYAVKLGKSPQPQETVTVTPISSDMSVATMSGALMFTRFNWNNPKSVTVSGVHNFKTTNSTVTITHEVTGGSYDDLPAEQVGHVDATVRNIDEPGMMLTRADTDIGEGQSASYTIRLRTIPPDNVIVAFRSSNESVVTISPRSLTFTPQNWNNSQPVRVSAPHDDTDAIDNAATIIYEASGGDYEGLITETPITVVDNDTPMLNISGAIANEGGRLSFRVTLTAVADENVTVQYATLNDSATAGEDYISTAGTLTIFPGARLETIPVSVLPDDQAEGDETLRLTLSNPSTNAQFLGGATTPLRSIGTIVDDDVRGVTISPRTLSLDEGTAASYTIRLNTAPSGTVIIQPRQTSPQRYGVATSGRLTFDQSNWQTAQTATLSSYVNDSNGYSEVTVGHAVSGSDYAGITVPGMAVTVVDNNLPIMDIKQARSKYENQEELLITVGLSRTAAQDVTVEYWTINDNAVAGDDYEAAVDQTLTITAGQLSATISIRIKDDSMHEARRREHFALYLDNISPNAQFRSSRIYQTQHQDIYIIDDDPHPTGIALSTNSSYVNEDGGRTTITVTATVEGGTTFDHERKITVAVTGNDRSSAVSFNSIPDFDIIIPTNAVSQTRTFTLVPRTDNIVTNNGMVEISGKDTGLHSLTVKSTAILLIDDEAPGVTVEPTTLAVTGGGTATYRVVLDAQPSTSVIITPNSISYQLGTDHSLTFMPSNWHHAQTVTVTGRGSISNTQKITHTVSGGSYAQMSIPDVTVIGGTNPVVVADSVEAYENDGKVVATVRLFKAHHTEKVTVAYRTEDNTARSSVAAASGDYEPASGTLTFAVGVVEQTIVVPLLRDHRDEPQESFSLVLENVSTNAEFVGGRSVQSIAVPIIINDSNVEPTNIMLSVDKNYVRENDGESSIVVHAAVENGAAFRESQTISISVANESDGVTSFDQVMPFNIIIPAGSSSSSGTLTLTPRNDSISNVNQTVIINGRVADSSSILVSSTQIVLVDDDVQGVTFIPSTLTISEGQEAFYTLILNARPSESFRMQMRSTPYTSGFIKTGYLYFTPQNWNNARRINISSRVDENNVDEVLSITHEVQNASSNLGLGPIDNVITTIIDTNDGPRIILPNTAARTFDESADNALIPISLSKSDTRDVTMDYWTSHRGGGRSTFVGKDHEAAKGILTIPAGQTSGTITIPLIDDNQDETVEHTGLVLDNFSSNVTAAQYYLMDIRIRDDDETPTGITLSASHSTVSEGSVPETIVVTATVNGDTTYGDRKRVYVTVSGSSSGPAVGFHPVSSFNIDIPIGSSSSTGTFTLRPRPDDINTANTTISIRGVTVPREYIDDYTQRYRINETPVTEATLIITDDDGTVGTHSALITDTSEPEIVLSPNTLIVRESGTAAYAVNLASPPAAPVIVTTSSEDSEVVSDGHLIFTKDDWYLSQTLTVAGVRDEDANNETLTVTHIAESKDPLYEGIAGSLIVIVTDDSASVLTGILMTSLPVGDHLYGINEEIRLALAFSKPVRTEGTPRLRLILGDHMRWAELRDGGGSDTLVFAYTVQADDRADVVRVPANALRLGQGDAIIDTEVSDISIAMMNDAVEFPMAVDGTRDTLLVAHAGEDFEVHETEVATLDGSESTSAEPRQMVYAWMQNKDDPVLVELNGRDTAAPNFTAPNLARNTEVRFVLTVANSRTGDEDSDEVMVTILAVNDPPIADAGTDQVVEPGVMVTLDGTASSDPEGEELSFAWVQAEDGTPRVELQDANTAMPTFRSLEIHRRDTPTTFVLTVTDPHGASDSDEVVVTTRAVDLSIVLRHALAGFGRSVASGLMDAVGGRFDNSNGDFVNLGGGASVRFADLAVPGVECGDAASDTAIAASSSTPRLASINETPTTPNAHNEAKVPRNTKQTAPPNDANACSPAMARNVNMNPNDPALNQRLSTNVAPTNNASQGDQSWYADTARALIPTSGDHFDNRLHDDAQNRSMGGSTERAFRFGGGSKAPGEGPSWVMWGQGDGRRFESQPQPTMSLKGDVQSSYLGIDYRLGERVVAGVAVSMSEGWVEYEHGRTTGDVWMNLSGAYPYAHWQPTDGLGAWAMAGGGSGAARITTDAGRDENTAIAMRMAAFGLRQQLATVLGVDWSVKTDAFAVRIDSAATYGLKPVQVDVHRARLVVEGRDSWNLSPSQQLRPSVELGGRVDGGDSESGHGMELGGGMGYANTALGLTVEVRGRALVGHSSEAFEDWGVSLRMEWTPVSLGGLSMSLSPSWGEAMSRTDAMWRSEWLLTGVTMGGDEASALNGWNPDQMDAELKYGFTVRDWSLSPYGKFGLGNHGDRRRYGVRLEALDMHSGELRLDLFGEHNSPLEGGNAPFNLGVEGTVRARFR